MNFYRPHFTILLLLGLLVGVEGIISPVAEALNVRGSLVEEEMAAQAAEEAATQEEAAEGVNCYTQLGTFLTNLLDFGSSKDYWEDIFVRNRCQQDDIFSLDEDIESLMLSLREEYSQHCNSPEITEYEEEIQEKKMEQYFVRHIVSLDERSTYKKDVEIFMDYYELYVLALQYEMSEKYVVKKKWVDETELQELLAEWQEDYQDRVAKYIDCNESEWQEVADKWKEFQEGLKDIVEVFQFEKNEAYTELREENEKDLDEIRAERTGEKNAEGSSIGSFLKNHIAMKINGLEPKKAFTQIIEEIKEVDDFFSSQQLLEVSALETERYQQDATMAELVARYDLLYKSGSADITKDLVYRIELLGLTIRQTTTASEFLAGLAESAKQIHKKQGSGVAK